LFKDVGRQAKIIVSWQDTVEAFKLIELVVRVIQGSRIGTSVMGIDRASIDNVSGNESATASLVETDAARTVAWCMQDL